MKKLAALLSLALAAAPMALATPPVPGPEMDLRFASVALTALGAAILIRTRR